MAAVPLEGRGRWPPAGTADRLTLWSCTQGAHGTRDELAMLFGVEPGQVHVITPDVGGGFGAKHGTTPEELLVPWLARRLDRPVRWAETRSENMVGMVQGRGQVQHASIAGTRDGRITGYRLDVIQEGGAYAGSGCVLPYMTRLMAPGCYDIDDVRVRIRSVVTNTSTVGAYRGAGRPEAAAAIERMVDRFAAEIGMDPVEVRRRNLLPPDAFPLRTATGGSYDSGDYATVLDAVLAAAGYDELRAQQAERRASERSDPARHRAVGVRRDHQRDAPGRRVRLGRDHLRTAGPSSAPGPRPTARATTPPGRCSSRTAPGSRSTASRSATATPTTSPEAAAPAARSRSRSAGPRLPRPPSSSSSEAKQLAADLLEADRRRHRPRRDLRHVPVAGTPVSAKSWADLAAAAPAQGIDRLLAETDFKAGGSTFPFGAHVSVVEVDTETGEPSASCATSPATTPARSSTRSSSTARSTAASPPASARRCSRRSATTTRATRSPPRFADYAFPSAAELPVVRAGPHETPTPHNPLGAKGIGESGTIGATPAVQNAVIDAVAAPRRAPHRHAAHRRRRVWTAIQAARPS